MTKLERIALAATLVLGAVAPACLAPEADEKTEETTDAIRTNAVRLYSEPNFGGKVLSLPAGDADLAVKDWNDRPRSIRIFGDFEAQLFADATYSGASATFTQDTTDLGALAGKVSSIRIRARGAITDAGTPPPQPTTQPDASPPRPPSSDLIGWAAVPGLGVSTTTGGTGGPTVLVKTLAELNTALAGTTPRVVQIVGTITGNANVGSNKTLLGGGGSRLTGSLKLDGSVNVIVRELAIVGYNCGDASACDGGLDAVEITDGSHHVWFDHCAVSDGSDGNFDIKHASDFITVSWTKFSYSGKRAGGHQFSNLIGHTDNSPEDQGKLNVTFHHDWWADNVFERMPRVRYGKVHAFNNLFTAQGGNYCMRAGVKASILAEANAFIGVTDPFDLADGDVLSKGNLFTNVTGTTADTGKAFTPPYAYSASGASAVEAAVRSGAGPR